MILFRKGEAEENELFSLLFQHYSHIFQPAHPLYAKIIKMTRIVIHI